MTETVLILGANGRFGRAAAVAFDEAGWSVRAHVRPGAAQPVCGHAVFADLDDADAMEMAAHGVDVIVNALHPAYQDWSEQLPRITDAVIAMARRSGAHVLIPGNIYNFGQALPEVLSEATPEAGDHKKASLRIEMEAAYRASGVPTIVLRGGDFIDTRSGDNWFEGQITAKVKKGRFVYPGPLDHVHAWAYLPDMARAAAALAKQRRTLARFQSVHFEGYAVTGKQLRGAVEQAVGPLKLKALPWWALRVIAPFNALMREVLAMRYLWQRPHRMDGTLFHNLLPDFQPTPLVAAVRASLIGSGRLAPGTGADRTEAPR